MLYLYYGRENLDKNRFLFEKIGSGLSRNHKIVLLVPDQFTLQAERNAFDYLGAKGLIDLEVMSQSRLGLRVLSETGGIKRTHIDQYGRHILLAKILSDEKDGLEVFRGMNQKASFIEMANNMISEMKQFNTGPEEIKSIMETVEETSILYRKLADIYKIYQKYEEMITGKYTDTEDYLDIFASQIAESQYVRRADVWVDGFDYFTPKTLKIIERLMTAAQSVSIVLTAEHGHWGSRDGELFRLTNDLMIKLKATANQSGVIYKEEEIGSDYQIREGCGEKEKTAALVSLEKELYAYPSRSDTADGSIELCCAANFYAEAETAAAKIVGLVRDKGLRYRDIAVICNDMDTRGSVLKRVFADYGIAAFLDKKRGIMHHPFIEFLLALIDVSARGWQYEDVFRLLKTDMTPVSADDYEDLENYAVKYRIRGKRWSKEFQYGIEAEGAEFVKRANASREQIVDFLDSFEKGFKPVQTVRQKTAGIYRFLRDRAQIPGKAEALIDEMVAQKEYESAEETAQIWGVILHIFDQIAELLGEQTISDEEYALILKSGFEAVEIGLIPPTIDQVLVGTMQRTRIGNIKALIVVGANDGLLPAATNSESLLNEEEKAVLYHRGIEICKIDDLRLKEEKMAIYKTLSKPTRYLWMSYSASDLEGKETRQSILFDKIQQIFPDIILEKDMISSALPMSKIESPGSTLKHMTEAFRSALDGEQLTDEWKAVCKWYQSSSEPRLRAVTDGIFFTNKQNKIEKELLDKLYRRGGASELVLSPSRLEKFSKCPFAHFILYAIRPDERRVFEIAGREIGDVYHQCFMMLSEQLTLPGIKVNDPESPWMKLTREDCQTRIDQLIDEAAAGYKEGVLVQGEEERYRSLRMKKVCGAAAWALVEHIQRGNVQQVFFESEFGRSSEKRFPAIEVGLNHGKVFIEGKIDRVDILNDDFVKIIDYKSGKERFDTEEAKAGWKLQLMLYLRAVMGNSEECFQGNGELKPAGVFYFEIADPQIDATEILKNELQEKLEKEWKKSFKLDGIVLDHASIIENIAGEFSGYSDILPVRKNKEGGYSGTSDGKLLQEEEFLDLLKAVDCTVERLCDELVGGSIDIRPKRVKGETACKFCLYKSICNFDISFEGCEYDVVK